MIISISCLAAGSSGDSGPFSRGLDLVGIAGLQEWSVSQLEFEAKKEVGPPHCTSGSCFLSRFGCFQSAEHLLPRFSTSFYWGACGSGKA